MSIIAGIDNDNPLAVLTPQEVFGDPVWLAPTVTGPNPTGIKEFPWNPENFASELTAQKVLGMVGGVEVLGVDLAALTPNNRYKENINALFIVLPSGKLINAGQVANFFTHNYCLRDVAEMIRNEIRNVETEDGLTKDKVLQLAAEADAAARSRIDAQA